jgi:hypothetical protein
MFHCETVMAFWPLLFSSRSSRKDRWSIDWRGCRRLHGRSWRRFATAAGHQGAWEPHLSFLCNPWNPKVVRSSTSLAHLRCSSTTRCTDHAVIQGCVEEVMTEFWEAFRDLKLLGRRRSDRRRLRRGPFVVREKQWLCGA